MVIRRKNEPSPSAQDEQLYALKNGDEAVYTEQTVLALHIGAHEDPGIRRKDRPNEDTLFVMQGALPAASPSTSPIPFVLLLVADGMGGQGHGRKASRLAVRSLVEYVTGSLRSQQKAPASLLALLSAGVKSANQAVYERNRQQHTVMGTTMTAVLMIETCAYVAHVGDSRLYHYREPMGLTQITHDHSLVATLVAAGIIAPEDIYTDPRRNQIYRCLGDKATLEVDTAIIQLAAGDNLLVCSDGLWEMVRDQQIAAILTTPTPTSIETAHALIQAALTGGGEDNVSAIVVQVSKV
jgi:serine/threonine protein phosphatase PrpC